MYEFSDYKLLRVTPDLSPDEDFAENQVVPSALAEISRGGELRGSEPIRIKVEILLQWLDAGGAVLTGDRGKFDLQIIRVTTRRGDTTSIVVDCAPLKAQIAYRPIIVDDILPGDAFTVRLSNMTRPGAAQARVLYREII
jgi:hypothetical protein